jgi:hypothetical protein
LRKIFAQAPFIEVGENFCSPDSQFPVQGLTVSGINGVHLRTPIGAPIPFVEDMRFVESWNLKVTKVGIIFRKGKSHLFQDYVVTPRADDLTEGSKRSADRKWREWVVILTSSQLLFFRDTNLMHTVQTKDTLEDDSALRLSRTLLRPEEIIVLKDCIAVYDMAYTKVRVFFLSNVLREVERHAAL